MVTLGFAIAIIGILIEFGSCIYMTFHIINFVKNIFSPDTPLLFSFSSLFQKYIRALAWLVLGMLMVMLGIGLANIG